MSNMQMIKLLTFLLILLLIFLPLINFWLKGYLMDRQKYSIFLNNRKKPPKDYICIWYDFFLQWMVTKRYVKNISRYFEIYLPGDYKRTAHGTMKLILKSWSLDLLLIIFLFTREPTLYWGTLTLAYMYIMNNQVIFTALRNNEIKLLKQFDKLLGDIRHNYQSHGMTQEALYDSIETAPYPVKLHASVIYNILNSEDLEEEVSKYKERAPNRFLNIFLSLSVLMMKFGDKKVDNQSLFLTNLKYLKQEINTEVLKREKMKHLFSGLVAVCVTPVLFLKAIEDWAVYSLPEMLSYYKGVFGILTMVIIFIATFFSYNLINQMKENSQAERKNPVILEQLEKIPFVRKVLTNIINKNYGKSLKVQDLIRQTGESVTIKQFTLKRIICSILTFFVCIFISITIHHHNKIQLLTNYNNVNYLSSTVSERQLNNIKEVIKTYVYQNIKITLRKEEVEEKLQQEGVIKSKLLMTMTVEEIINRINRYHEEYYRWYELLLTFLVSIAAYYIPYLNLLFIRKLRRMNMEDEVIQFHSIILMLMHFDRMTIETILVWLENFADIFKKSIRECLNDLQSGDLEVLEDLKRKEPYEPFVKLIENLQISDKIGISKAFDEIAVERFHYQEKRKLENEIYINDRSLLGKVIAFIPFFITIGLYLIIPFIVEGLNQYAQYMEQMKSIY